MTFPSRRSLNQSLLDADGTPGFTPAGLDLLHEMISFLHHDQIPGKDNGAVFGQSLRDPYEREEILQWR